jgi:tRNA (cmo5U34)-methyltransferase
VADFEFDQQVVEVFPDMIKRSVPGYTTTISMIGDLSRRYAKSGSRCYDLGCSLGAATLAMRHNIQAADCTIVGVDNSDAMLKRCQQVLDADSGEVSVELIKSDLQDLDIQACSVVVMNFTLQFIPRQQRLALIQKIYANLLPGGVLIISEKVQFEQQAHQELMVELHHNFKRSNGYSDLEIAQKRSAIEHVLLPETLQQHIQRLHSAGFSSADVWFQCFNFASLIAIK